MLKRSILSGRFGALTGRSDWRLPGKLEELAGMLMFRVLSNQHYQHRTNQKLRLWANAVFQNRGVCGQAFPSFPSPFPVIPFFLLSSQPTRQTGAETLATQANRPLSVKL